MVWSARFFDGLIPAHAGKTADRVWDRAPWPAHPRSRGENQLSLTQTGTRRGSSPLTRGKPGLHRGRRRPRGLIPAHAGKTQGVGRRVRQEPAHPRSRGENTLSASTCCSAAGSSPLTRGKPPHQTPNVNSQRLIPAHAGKTWFEYRGDYGCAAHPRSRGENPERVPCAMPARGSSPLTRGKPSSPVLSLPRLGLIPAHAGKTQPLLARSSRAAAHPRSRGENSSVRGRLTPSSGSSPLTRGKHADVYVISHQLRLIPAHAGKTPRRRAPCRTRGAHPRSRGENAHTGHVRGHERGSSPLTRGKLPTCSRANSASAAHPRSRGENVGDPPANPGLPGSSPLTRGKPARPG